MKEYVTPSLEKSCILLENVIATSNDSIVASSDAQGASETQESVWDDSWN